MVFMYGTELVCVCVRLSVCLLDFMYTCTCLQHDRNTSIMGCKGIHVHVHVRIMLIFIYIHVYIGAGK